jgi:putative AlgH/UPF0301 family transcriptional regulator
MSSPRILRSLYRSLWRALKPLEPPAATAAVWQSLLLDRTAVEDRPPWHPGAQDSRDDTQDEVVQSLFRKILRQAMGRGGNAAPTHLNMRFPSQIDTSTCSLRSLLRREFQAPADEAAAATRQAVCFLVMRKLNEKLSWAHALRDKLPSSPLSVVAPSCKHAAIQPAPQVHVLPAHPAADYLRPGAFLLAHPLLTGYFRRTVLCILDHREESTDLAAQQARGTYGLIVNRLAVTDEEKVMRLEDALYPMPEDLAEHLGDVVVRDGGPVHASLQMLHVATAGAAHVGGTLLETITDTKDDDPTVADTTLQPPPIKYQGDLTQTAAAVAAGHLDATTQVSIYLGASSWTVGQLQSEVERGLWLPCRAPVALALQGRLVAASRSENDDDEQPQVEASTGETTTAMDDLYLSMLAACGPREAELARLIQFDDKVEHPYRRPCDSF